MADVRVVALRKTTAPSGEAIKPGESFCVEQKEAKHLVESGEVCLYASFHNSMIKKRKVRVKEAPENTAASVERQTGMV